MVTSCTVSVSTSHLAPKTPRRACTGIGRRAVSTEPEVPHLEVVGWKTVGMTDEDTSVWDDETSPAEGTFDKTLLPERRRLPWPGKTGSDLAADVVSTAAGVGAVFVFGPFGVLIAPFANAALKKLVARLGVDRVFLGAEREFVAQQLAPREFGRVAVAYNTAAVKVMERLRAGERLRDDGFFPKNEGEAGSAARAALDGVLLKARDSYDQRKAERLGELYAWLAFHPEISPSHGNFLIELAGRLTYTQLLMLGLFAGKDETGLPDWQSTGAFTPLEMGLVAEIEELARQELILRDDNQVVATFTDVNPQRMKTVLNGLLLCEAMNLEEAEHEDWEEVADLFARLGKVESVDGKNATARMEMVVPRGKPPEVNRVQLNHQVVVFSRPTVGLADFEGEASDPASPGGV